MKTLILQSLILMLPVMTANGSPVLAARLNFFEFLNIAIWEKGLGRNKTWRGLFVGLLSSALTALLLFLFETKGVISAKYLIFDYAEMGITMTLLFATLQGFATLGTDSLKSYFKRRLNRPPGSPWPPFDELDFLGGFLVSYIFVSPPAAVALLIIIGGPFAVAIINASAYLMKIKKVPW